MDFFNDYYKNFIYDRRLKEMSKGNKKKEKKTNAKTTTPRNEDSFSKLLSPLISIIATIFIAMIGFLGVNVYNLNGTVSSLNTSVQAIENKDTGLPSINTKITDFSIYVKNLENRIENLENKVKILEDNKVGNNASKVYTYKPTGALLICMKNVKKNNSFIENAPSWKSTDIIAKDIKTEKEYTAKQLEGKKILIPYFENGQEVYFYGQFNTENHWNGDCILNVYKDSKLTYIMEAKYNDGNLLSYKQVFKYTTSLNIKVWSISKRTHKGNVNHGESRNYIRNKNKKKKFNMKNVTSSDILTVDKFKKSIKTPLEAYYCGNTSNGSYNDKTGNAYLVKYASDGTIRTLYCGNFENGKFEDSTGKAWYIVRNPKKGTDYVYYKGDFKDGEALGKDYENHLSIKEIKQIIGNRKFNCKLNWYDKNKYKA